MDVDFLDGSGEALELGLVADMRKVWELAFKEATIMIFCLPIWMVFPNDDEMNDEDWEEAETRLVSFNKLVATYDQIRNQKLKVRTILALTMADDERSALRKLRNSWIKPCTDSEEYFTQLKSFSGVPRYLASAQDVSEYIYREFKSVRHSPMCKNIYKSLNFGHGLPWLIPMSALNGNELVKVNQQWKDWENGKMAKKPRPGPPPVPAHVDLPMLAALVEWKNAIM
jgi:hypothetical protein